MASTPSSDLSRCLSDPLEKLKEDQELEFSVLCTALTFCLRHDEYHRFSVLFEEHFLPSFATLSESSKNILGDTLEQLLITSMIYSRRLPFLSLLLHSDVAPHVNWSLMVKKKMFEVLPVQIPPEDLLVVLKGCKSQRVPFPSSPTDQGSEYPSLLSDRLNVPALVVLNQEAPEWFKIKKIRLHPDQWERLFDDLDEESQHWVLDAFGSSIPITCPRLRSAQDRRHLQTHLAVPKKVVSKTLKRKI